MRLHSATLLALPLAITTQVAAAQSVKVHLAPGSRIVVNGTSNVHKWDCFTTDFTAAMEAPTGSPNEAGKALNALEVTIPVQSINCGEGAMTNNMRKAMHASEHPTITFRMTSYRATPIRNGAAYDATVAGQLTINAVEKPVQLKATVTPDGRGGARAEGSVDIKTTDFGVPPVKALLGTIRTGERVTVVLTIVAVPR